MALSAKWLDGDLIFYDGIQEVYRIKNSTEGIVVGTTGAGVPSQFHGEMTYPDPNTATTTGTVALTTTSNRIQFLNPGTTGSRTITLSPTATSAGIEFRIFNTGTSGDLAVKTTGDSTIITIGINEGGIATCDGSNWYGMVGGNS